MARRMEITVPNLYREFARGILEDPAGPDLGELSDKPGIMAEIHGERNTVFLLTLPGPVVSTVLDVCKKNGIGIVIGNIVLGSLDCIKPRFNQKRKKLSSGQVMTADEIKQVAADQKKVDATKPANAAKMGGFKDFQKARLTTEEIYNNIFNGANMTMNTWINLIGASTMAAGGATSNASVFIVAAMLVSPIMGPILGMTFGYRIADWDLFKMSFINEFKMAVSAFLVGFVISILIGSSKVATNSWPTDVMMMSKVQSFNLVVSVIVSAAAGCILGVSVTSGGVNALVGTAISAGLLPPIVNAGMMISYSWFYCPLKMKSSVMEMGIYSLLFYTTHVITIVVVANILFAMKAIDSRFKDKDDSNFDDIPSLQEHRQKLIARGIDPDDRKNIFVPHLLLDKLSAEVDKVKNMTVSEMVGSAVGTVVSAVTEVKNKTQMVASAVTGGFIPDAEQVNQKHHWAQEDDEEVEMSTIKSNRLTAYNPIQFQSDDAATLQSSLPIRSGGAASAASILFPAVPDFIIGSRVVDIDGNIGTVRYIGPVVSERSTSNDTWIGVEWDKLGRGKNNGSLLDNNKVLRTYFTCEENMGSFVRPIKLKILNFEDVESRSFTTATTAIGTENL